MSVFHREHHAHRPDAAPCARALLLAVVAVLAVVPAGIAIAAATSSRPYGTARPILPAAIQSAAGMRPGAFPARILPTTRSTTSGDVEALRTAGYPDPLDPAAVRALRGAVGRNDARPRASYGALALPCGVFTNCSFETGTLAGWISTDLATPGFPARAAPAGTSSGTGSPSTPTDGGFSYVNGFDGGGPGVITLMQDVILSPSATRLEFDYRAAWIVAGTLDRRFRVNIEPSGGGVPLQSDLILTAATGTSNADTGPLAGSVSVSAFAGQSVRIVFAWEVPENFTGPAYFDLDRIRVAESICGPVANCSFETGSASSWTLADFPSPYFPSFVAPAGYNPGFGLFVSAPTAGALALVHSFDTGTPGDMTLRQDLTLPAGALSVEFDYRAGWDMRNYDGSTLPRSFTFELQPSGGGAPLISQLVLRALPGSVLLDTGPRTRIIDVSAHAGQPVRLVFRWNVPQSFTGPACFQLDRVALSASACGDISNCSFETGSLPAWSATEFANPLYPQHVGSVEALGFGFFTTAPSNGGKTFIMGFDAGGPDTAALHQDVTMPVWASRLRFDYRAAWDMLSFVGSTRPRTFRFDIEPSGGGPVLASQIVLIAPPRTQLLDSGPVTRSVDVSAFAGQDVRLVFRWDVPQSFTGPGLFQLDHVALNSSLLDAPPAGRPLHTLSLMAATPNPARASTTFRFTLPSAGDVELEIVDVRGGRVWYERRAALAAGEHALAWDGKAADGRDAPAGVYFARVHTGDAGHSRMFVRVK